ncbi:exodeoxyribonuclease VII large subunit [Janibacter melonis]|uniref:exodeoxyribonuclease VII large subunit n=1 Tax=Janibacter melonis TaxID=262209 RepID=UPI001785AA99|nr:hypothetical protein [Janibacter melonis]
MGPRSTTVAALTCDVNGRIDDPQEVWITGEVLSVRQKGPYAWVDIADDTGRCEMYIEARSLRGVGGNLPEGAVIRARARVKSHSSRPTWFLRVIWLELVASRSARAAEHDRLVAMLHEEGVLPSADPADVEFRTRIPDGATPPIRRLIALVPSSGTDGSGDVLGIVPKGVKVDWRSVTEAGDMVVGCIKELEQIGPGEADAVLITRGGGDRVPLRRFDDPDLARAIHSCPLPVLTAVGHNANKSVADLAADVAFQTPSTAAEAIKKSYYAGFHNVSQRRSGDGSRAEIDAATRSLDEARAEVAQLRQANEALVHRLAVAERVEAGMRWELDRGLLADARSRVRRRVEGFADALAILAFIAGSVGQSSSWGQRGGFILASVILGVAAVAVATTTRAAGRPVSSRRAHLAPASRTAWRAGLPAVRTPRELQLYTKIPSEP